MCARTRLFTLALSLGSVESLIQHPAQMTHCTTGGTRVAVPDALVRLSVGLEDPDDLIVDCAAPASPPGCLPGPTSMAVTVAEAHGDASGVVDFADLGPYALLGQLPPDLVDNDMLPLGLFSVLRLGRGHELLHTLEVFLDCAGDKQRTADVLAVRRSTLYHRLDRIEQLSGLDLADGGDRLLAHVAVKVCTGSAVRGDAPTRLWTRHRVVDRSAQAAQNLEP